MGNPNREVIAALINYHHPFSVFALPDKGSPQYRKAMEETRFSYHERNTFGSMAAALPLFFHRCPLLFLPLRGVLDRDYFDDIERAPPEQRNRPEHSEEPF